MKTIIHSLFIACFLPAALSAAGNSRIDYKLSPGARIVSLNALSADDLKEGNILISLENGGSLSKVLSRQGEPLETGPAAMEEAFESLDASYEGRLEPGEVASAEYFYDGLSLSASKGDAKEFDLKLDDVVLYDYDGNAATEDDRVVVNGDMKFLLGLDWDIKIEENSMREMNFVSDIEQKSGYEVKFSTPIRVSLPFGRQFKLMEYMFAPVVVGPVVFTPVVTVSAGFNVGLSGEVRVNIEHKLSGRYGTSYANGDWNGVYETDERSFKGSLAFLGADGWAKGYAGPRIKLNFYNMVGPYVEGFGHVRATAETAGLDPLTIDWGLYGGLQANAGVSVKVFSLFMKDFKKTIAAYERPIASGTFGANEPKAVAVTPHAFDAESAGLLTPELISHFTSGR